MQSNTEKLREVTSKKSDLQNMGDDTAVQKTGKIEQMSEVSTFSIEELNRLKLLYPGIPNGKLLNVFRDLRTRLNKKAKGKNYVCLVSSLVGGGGGSYIAANLAAAIALDRTKTSLLIDGNLYAPWMDRLLVGEPGLGLTDYLYREETEIEEIVHASGIPRLRVIPVGNNREGGAEYFSTARMRQFIDSVKSRYYDRFIIIDAPAACDYSAETHILADLCDFAVLVVPYGKVTEPQLTAGLDVIGREKLAGLVFNN